MIDSDWERYWKHGFEEVEGWVSPNVRWQLEAIDQVQAQLGLRGSVLEIGVHHGKFFIPLALLSDPGKREKCIAIDVFEQQELNIDGSGKGARAPFDANVRRYCPKRHVEVIQADSLSFTIADRVRLVQEHGPVRIASIDGGHTAEHTVNDLALTQDLAAGGGVIIVDDFFNAHWPGVHEGVARFFLLGTPKLKPFACSISKVYLTDFSHHGVYYRAFLEKFRHLATLKEVTMYGSPVVAIREW